MRTEHGRQPNLTEVQIGDLRLAIWDWPGAEPALVFAHATSFHARCWDSIIREFPDCRCVAFDARGHGRSSKPAPPYHWGVFREDLLGILRQFEIKQAIGIGHSMGGHALTAAAAVRGDAFRALVLVDPTIRGPEGYDAPFDVSFVRKRRALWQSPDEMFESFRGRLPFSRWQPEVLRDYCDFGLLPEGRRFVLACPPDIEASIYECSKEPETKLYDAVAAVKIPVTVLRAGYGGDLPFSRSPTDPRLALRFPQAQDVLLEDRTHFIPMEAPDLLAEYVRRQLRRVAP